MTRRSHLWAHAPVRDTIAAGESVMGNAAAAFDLRPRADARSVAAERTASIPWYVWCLAAATAADLFGGYWDISGISRSAATLSGPPRT